MSDLSRKYRDRAHYHSADADLAELAGRQHGVVSVARLRELGFSKHAVRYAVERKRLLPLHRGVYAVGHDSLTPDSRRMAAVLACGPGALLSHRAGAFQRDRARDRGLAALGLRVVRVTWADLHDEARLAAELRAVRAAAARAAGSPPVPACA